MPIKPVVGVIACNREVEGEAAQTVKNRYVEGVSKYADAVPFIVPTLNDPADAPLIVARLDALLLTGSSSNIEPFRYSMEGQGRLPHDGRRDAMSSALIHAAIAAGKPVFGICRGFQEINVALGGTLVDQRDTEGTKFFHHAPDGVSLDDMFGYYHDIDVLPDTPLSRYSSADALKVNSVHYQTLGKLGDGLVVNARGRDGVIESISTTNTKAPVFAVQWHPEWHPDARPHDLAFWRFLRQTAQA